MLYTDEGRGRDKKKGDCFTVIAAFPLLQINRERIAFSVYFVPYRVLNWAPPLVALPPFASPETTHCAFEKYFKARVVCGLTTAFYGRESAVQIAVLLPSRHFPPRAIPTPPITTFRVSLSRARFKMMKKWER